MKSRSIPTLLLTILTATAPLAIHAQTSELGQTSKNYISTGMPVLLIAPDAISSGMGDAGVASRPDAYSAHWNNAMWAFAEYDMSFSTSYTPWLRKLGVGDMNLLYLGGYKRINDRSTVGISLTYFSLGDIESTDESGTVTGNMHPNEFAVDVTYAMKIGDNFALGASGRLNHSDLTNGQTIGTQTTKAANSLAADIGLYYQQRMNDQQEWALGLFISNLGSKLSYSDDDIANEFLPANMRLGGRYSHQIDEYNSVNVLLDINKLLVPTPPMRKEGETDAEWNARYTDYQKTGVIQGALESLYDAPGGFSEKLKELQVSAGAEYWYNSTFAARVGYFYEHEDKGGRQYATVGAGIRYNILSADFSYLIPTTQLSNNPLSNTVRISLTLNFESAKR